MAESKPTINEAVDKNWEVLELSIKEIRRTIPSHCFQRNTLKSFLYGYAAIHIKLADSTTLRIALWCIYWVAQGIVATGVWQIGHECGHQAFSPSKTINHGVGFFVHTFLLVPYHSWRFSHSKHHKFSGLMSKYNSVTPLTRDEIGLPSRDKDHEADGPHSILEESPIVALYNIVFYLLFAWPCYLFTGNRNQRSSGWVSHFNPYGEIFRKSQFWYVMASNFVKLYVIPYLHVNSWFLLVTYLNHTDHKVPLYRDNVWNFQRGAALTIDRSFGSILNHFQHHVADTHVVHHFFPTIPHYHAKEATMYIKKALGKHYNYYDTPFFSAFWNACKQCKFVENDGDIVFYKN
ncbi:delta-12-fatty acid desaturase [Sporodiniella umbellata]|nr:delta-12-fatty acid desaturase [Sporodiniella umbellata]